MTPDNNATAADPTDFFGQGFKTLGTMLTPFGEAMQYSGGKIANAVSYTSWKTAAETNGAGPVADPAMAPWSFEEFVLGKRNPANPIAANPSQVSHFWLGLTVTLIVAWFFFLRSK